MLRGSLRDLSRSDQDVLRQMTGQTHDSQHVRIEDENWHEAEEPATTHEDMGQARGQGITEQSRHSITVEACQTCDFLGA